MSYQPNLFIRNIGNISAKAIHDLISNFKFGKVSKIEILNKKKEKSAIVKMEYWDTKHTECTRIMLAQGKPIELYHTDDDCLKVYAYKEEKKRVSNDDDILKKKRENEKKQQAKRLKIQKKKEEEILKKELARIAEECRIQEEIEREMKEQWKELNEELEAKQVILDYGNIAEYKGNTRASERLQKMLKKLK